MNSEILTHPEYKKVCPNYVQLIQLPAYQYDQCYWEEYLTDLQFDYQGLASDMDKAAELAYNIGTMECAQVLLYKIAMDNAFEKAKFFMWYRRYKTPFLCYYLTQFAKEIPYMNVMHIQDCIDNPESITDEFQAMFIVRNAPLIRVDQAQKILEIGYSSHQANFIDPKIIHLSGFTQFGEISTQYPAHAIIDRFEGLDEEILGATFGLIERFDPYYDLDILIETIKNHSLVDTFLNEFTNLFNHPMYWYIAIQLVNDNDGMEQDTLELLQKSIEYVHSDIDQFVSEVYLSTKLFDYKPSFECIEPFLQRFTQANPQDTNAQWALDYLIKNKG